MLKKVLVEMKADLALCFAPELMTKDRLTSMLVVALATISELSFIAFVIYCLVK